MDPTFATAIVVAAVSIGGSWFVTRGDRQRVESLERRIDKLESKDRRWWVWAQEVVTLYSQWRKANSPELPPVPIDDPSGE